MPLGNSLAFIKLHKTRFLGPFGIPTQTFTFLISPITISFSSKTKHQAKLSVTGQYYCRDQTVTERPVRPRVSAPTIMYIRTYVYLCHTPVTLIKSTYLLTYLLYTLLTLFLLYNAQTVACMPIYIFLTLFSGECKNAIGLGFGTERQKKGP